MKDFTTMSTKVFGEKSENIIRFLEKDFEGVFFENEEEFLKKVSMKLEKKLIRLKKAEGNTGKNFWLSRVMQLRQNRNDSTYMAYIVEIISPIPKQLLEKDSLTKNEKKNLEWYAYSYLNGRARHAEKCDDSAYKAYQSSEELDTFFSEAEKRRMEWQ